jgi:hypothetical protein
MSGRLFKKYWLDNDTIILLFNRPFIPLYGIHSRHVGVCDIHRRDAEVAEFNFFSFIAETPTNENSKPLRGRIISLE